MVGSYDDWIRSFEVHRLVEFIIRECGTHTKVWRDSFEIHADCGTDYYKKLEERRAYIATLCDTAFEAPVYCTEVISEIPAPEQ
jgi:hypothetical protein